MKTIFFLIKFTGKRFQKPFFYISLIYMSVSSFADIKYSEYIDSSFSLFWPCPVRAYPNIPLDFRFSAYDIDNRPLTWSLSAAPEGMVIDSSTGQVDWTPTQTGSHNINVEVTNGVLTLSKSFKLSVNTDDFIFVSTDGNDNNGNGSQASPFRTIEKALRSISGSNGKTVYIEGGTYKEHYLWESNNINAPLRFQYFSEEDPVEVRSLPNQEAILDCEKQGHGLWAFSTSYVIFSNITVINAGARAGIYLSSDNSIAKDVTVYDADFTYRNNPTGFLVQNCSNTIVDHCTGYDNYDRSNPSNWNSSNFLIYTETELNEGNIYILNNTSYGSTCGFKIKHAGPAKAIFHNNFSINDTFGFALMSDYSSIRFCKAFNNQTGIILGATDINAYNNKTVLVEHNTVVNCSNWGLSVKYATSTIGNIIANNIIYNNGNITGSEKGNRLMGFWIYDDNASSYPFTAYNNVFYSPDEDGTIFRLGREQYTLEKWKNEFPLDTSSLFGDPLFTATENVNLTIPEISLANFGNGDYAGAYPPGGKFIVEIDSNKSQKKTNNKNFLFQKSTIFSMYQLNGKLIGNVRIDKNGVIMEDKKSLPSGTFIIRPNIKNRTESIKILKK